MGCWDCIHPSMPHHCSLDGNHRTQTSSCGGDSSKQQHLALWQTEQAVALVALELPLGLSQGKAVNGVSGFSSPFHCTVFLIYLFGVKRPTLFHKANTTLLKPGRFLHKPYCTSISIPFHCPHPLWKCKNRQAFWQQPHWHSISYPTCRENQKLNVLFSVLDIVSLYFHLLYLQYISLPVKFNKVIFIIWIAT